MRSKVIFGLLLILLAGFVAVLALRGREPYQPTAAAAVPSAEASASAAASSATAGASAKAATSPSASGSAAAAAPGKLLDRPLRVVGLGWDLVTPGIVANGGVKPGKDSAFKKRGIEVELRATEHIDKLEAALASGGGDEKGADIALLPLQRFVASYERLRALHPVMFFVVGWSRGREVVVSERGSFAKLPTSGKVEVHAVAGDTASFVGLFAMELAGIEPARVELVDNCNKGCSLSAITRSATKADSEQVKGEVLLTTGTASRLVPLVAVAQASLVDQHTPALAAWARVWIEGQQKVSADVTAASRQIAEVKGAPKPLDLLSQLGEIAAASPADSVQLTGLSGRDAVTLESLFRRTWRIWREAKVLTIPPENAPVDGRVVSALVRTDPDLIKGGGTGAGKSGGSDGAIAAGAKPLLIYREPKGKLDEEHLLSAMGFIAGVFPRSPLRISVHPSWAVDAKRTKQVIERVRERYGVAAERLVTGKAKPKAGAPATVEVFPIP